MGFGSITSMFFLWVIGRFKGEHELMYKAYLDVTGKSASQLSVKLEEERKQQNSDLKILLSRIEELEDNYQSINGKLDHFQEKLVSFEDKMERLIVHKENNSKVSTGTMLDLLTDIQSKLNDKK